MKTINSKKENGILYPAGKKMVILFAILTMCIKKPKYIFVMTAKGGDFIPSRLSEFDEWQENFVDKVNSYKAGWGWDADTTAEWDLLTNTPGVKKMKWDAAYAPVATNDFKGSEEELMLEAKQQYESGDPKNPADTSIRIFINRHIRFSAKVTVDQKIAMGLIVPDTKKTKKSGEPSSSKMSSEISSKLKKYQRLGHTLEVKIGGRISLAPEDGVESLDMFFAITDITVKVSPAQSAYNYGGKVKRGMITKIYEEDMEGKRAWYQIRPKINGVYGKGSDPISAIIP